MIGHEEIAAAVQTQHAMATGLPFAPAGEQWLGLLAALEVTEATPVHLSVAMDLMPSPIALLNGFTLGVIAGRTDAARLARP